MNYNRQRHKELVIRSEDLKNQGKSLFIENPKEYSEWVGYGMAVEEHIFYSHREEFLLVMTNFIDNISNFNEFNIAFTLLYQKTSEEFERFAIDLKQIEKFQPSARPYRFATAVSAIFRQFEAVEDDYCTEQELKDYVKETYLEIQKAFNEE